MVHGKVRHDKAVHEREIQHLREQPGEQSWASPACPGDGGDTGQHLQGKGRGKEAFPTMWVI